MFRFFKRTEDCIHSKGKPRAVKLLYYLLKLGDKNMGEKLKKKYLFLRVRRKKRITALVTSCVILFGISLALFIYVSDYYRADMSAIEDFGRTAGVTESELDDGTLVFSPEEAECGFIFYPGGKVEHKAYIPLMRALAGRGILCVLIKMPFNLAVLDVNAADGIQEKYKEIDTWFIGGHSLGGSMAASYLGSHTDEYEGLVLLGSYSTEDLSDASVGVLSIYGSLDGVMNREKYMENTSNLPKNFTEFIIDGGSHAYFGMYGEQKGDGKAEITQNEQIIITADRISEFFAENSK